VPLLGRDEADRAVSMNAVVPAHELEHPLARRPDVGEAVHREARSVLRRAEQGLRVGVVVAHSRAAERGADAESLERDGQRARALRGAVVGVQHRKRSFQAVC